MSQFPILSNTIVSVEHSLLWRIENFTFPLNQKFEKLLIEYHQQLKELSEIIGKTSFYKSEYVYEILTTDFKKKSFCWDERSFYNLMGTYFLSKMNTFLNEEKFSKLINPNNKQIFIDCTKPIFIIALKEAITHNLNFRTGIYYYEGRDITFEYHAVVSSWKEIIEIIFSIVPDSIELPVPEDMLREVLLAWLDHFSTIESNYDKWDLRVVEEVKVYLDESNR